MLQSVVAQFKAANGNDYSALYNSPYPYVDALKPYLGQTHLAEGSHVFGGRYVLFTWGFNREDLGVVFYDLQDIDVCVEAISHFGQVIDDQDDTYYVQQEGIMRGFIGGSWEYTGCEKYSRLNFIR